MLIDNSSFQTNQAKGTAMLNLGGVDLISLVNLVQLQGLWGKLSKFMGLATKVAPTLTNSSTQEPIKTQEGGVGYADEALFLLAFITKWKTTHGLLVNGDVTDADLNVFIDILRQLNAKGRAKAARILAHIVGFKGATETVKVPRGTRPTKNAQGQMRQEKIYAEHVRELNYIGANIVGFFGAIGADKAIALLEESHVLDNLEDKTALGLRKAGIEAALLQKEGDTTMHVGMALVKLGFDMTLLKKVLDTPSLKKKRQAIDAETDVDQKRVLHEEYQGLLIKKTKALLKASPEIAKPGWSKSDKLIRIGGPTIIVVLLIILGTA
ncbi:MAG: hypothetical protein ABI747_04730 [Candidatus Moraniibacteriota bacterium]